MIRDRWIGIAMLPYSSIHTCAYDHAIELLNFFGYGRLPCVPCPHATCFLEADNSVSYRFVCLWTANSGPTACAGPARHDRHPSGFTARTSGMAPTPFTLSIPDQD